MVPTLEAIKGGGGSIKVGATGTISYLISRELESTKSAPRTPVSSRKKSGTVPSPVSGPMTPRRFKPRRSLDEASSSGSIISMDTPGIGRKTRHYNRKPPKIPMLESDNISIEGTPVKVKPDKRGSYIVEVVDIKCGNPDGTWAPITNRLKKLGFSKLSESTS